MALNQAAQWIQTPTQEIKETRIQPLIRWRSLEEEMATHTSILAWKTPWAEEPGDL